MQAVLDWGEPTNGHMVQCSWNVDCGGQPTSGHVVHGTQYQSGQGSKHLGKAVSRCGADGEWRV